MSTWLGAVLAAGQGSRMRSRTPKPLHLLSGQPLVSYSVRAVSAALDAPTIVVQAPGVDLSGTLRESVLFAEQQGPMGTGGALSAIAPLVGADVDHLLVINGDTPFISAASLRLLMSAHAAAGATMTFLTSRASLQEGLGRVLRDASGNVEAIIEAEEMGSTANDAPHEVNCGAYCLDAAWLWTQLPSLTRHESGEYYLTDLVHIANAMNRPVQTVETTDPWESFGINTRVHLSQAETEMRHRVLQQLMLSGVTIVDPATTYIDAGVEIGQDTVIQPNTHLHGQTVIGQDCRIGPGAQIRDSRIGHSCVINASILEEAVLEETVDIGPYCHLRPGAYLSQGVHLGNFAEVKASRLGRNVAMGHFSYVGDADIGDNVNIGAGVITCNFDGVTKHRTIVEEGAFLGSDTMLVAPVRVGARAATGAGSVVTDDLPPDSLAVGVPARVRSPRPKPQE